jgi:integrase
LAEFIDGYLKGRTDTKAGTKTNYGQARRHLIEYFGAERAIDSITAGDADEYRRHLLAEWRLIFALARFGGLRTPSELLTLRWADVNLPAGRMTVHRPKTEGHAGKAMRVVPIFAELRPYLEDCEALTEPGTEFVINRYRQANINLRTPLERIIGRAGLTPWPKLF